MASLDTLVCVIIVTQGTVSYSEHLAGAPEGSENLGPHLPRTRGDAGCDFFMLKFCLNYSYNLRHSWLNLAEQAPQAGASDFRVGVQKKLAKILTMEAKTVKTNKRTKSGQKSLKIPKLPVPQIISWESSSCRKRTWVNWLL